jgi:hypothetical protein
VEENRTQATGAGAQSTVLHQELGLRTKVDEFRPRLIQWAREVEKPLAEVGDLRAAHVHLRHLLNVANAATLLEEIILYVEYQGARRSLHIPVATRIKGHLREIQKLAGNDERLGLILAQNYSGYVTRVAKIAQVQRGTRPGAKLKPGGGPNPQPQAQGQGQNQQGQGGQGGRPRGGNPQGQPGKGRPGGKGRGGQPRPEGGPREPRPQATEAAAHEASHEAEQKHVEAAPVAESAPAAVNPAPEPATGGGEGKES